MPEGSIPRYRFFICLDYHDACLIRDYILSLNLLDQIPIIMEDLFQRMFVDIDTQIESDNHKAKEV